jgi:uncharacterized membrane protein (DUF4010 family)
MLANLAHILSVQERRHILVFTLAALLLWLWLPDRMLHEHLPVNPKQVLRLMIILSAIQLVGHVVLRWLGPRMSLSLAGLVSGFVSSTATHAAMGAQARVNPTDSQACASAAVLSNVATALQAMLMISSITAASWVLYAPYLLSLSAAAVVCGVIAFTRINDVQVTSHESRFSMRQSLVFAALLTAISGVSAFIQHEWGQMAAWIASGLAAMVDVHVAIASIASQPVQTEASVTIPLLICLTINAGIKAVIAWVSAGASRFATEVSLYLVLMACAPWCVWLLKG